MPRNTDIKKSWSLVPVRSLSGRPQSLIMQVHRHAVP